MHTITQGSLHYLDWFQRESFSLRSTGRRLARYVRFQAVDLDAADEEHYQMNLDIEEGIRVCSERYVSFDEYKAAADRSLKGKESEGDELTCALWHAQDVERAKRWVDASPLRSVWDLPVARALYEAERLNRSF